MDSISCYFVRLGAFIFLKNFSISSPFESFPFSARVPSPQLLAFSSSFPLVLCAGGFSFVYSVEDVNSGELFAVKRLLCQVCLLDRHFHQSSFHLLQNEENKQAADREVNLLKTIEHQHIVKYHGACRSVSHFFFLFVR
jgi:hypothetical protein